MAYNTGNPVGSNDPRDLFDNTVVLDNLELGAEPSYPDRIGRARKSRSGMEAEFSSAQELRNQEFQADQSEREQEFQSDQAEREQEFQSSQDSREQRFNLLIASSGYADKGDYQAGLVLTDYNQIFRRDGEYYKLALSVPTPYTLTGNWASESSKFVAIGDAALRQELSQGVPYSVNDLALYSVAGAAGNGVTNDTAAFTAFEASVSGRTIDLHGRIFLVDYRPQKNTYINGRFVVSGAARPAQLSEGFTIPFGRYHHHGGQLSRLKSALCNPFEQFTGIVFCGDSITWGATLPENLNPGSDLTTLATRRDLFASPSFVNEFKRYIGREYFDNAIPVISNWAASSAGEAIATYVKSLLLYPNRAPFAFVASGTASITDTAAPSAATGFQATLAASAGANTATITFPFTGEAFTVVFTAVGSDATAYEVLVDGVSIGTFDTAPNGTTIIDGSYGNRISHTFSYVRNKTITIRINGVGAPTIRRLRIEAIEIPKTVRITNQGISGSNSTRYRSRALTTAFLPDIAVTAKDNYAFVQLGTNDRGPDSTWPNGLNSFEKQMAEICDILDPLCDTIIMSANHVGPSNQAGKTFTMQQIRGALASLSRDGLARGKKYDFVDNFGAFTWADPSVTLADSLHPNSLGHQMIYRNIVEALEQA
ncbi:GDSL-type esterase/lipase family protein [Pseudomonas laurentiana]